MVRKTRVRKHKRRKPSGGYTEVREHTREKSRQGKNIKKAEQSIEEDLNIKQRELKDFEIWFNRDRSPSLYHYLDLGDFYIFMDEECYEFYQGNSIEDFVKREEQRLNIKAKEVITDDERSREVHRKINKEILENPF